MPNDKIQKYTELAAHTAQRITGSMERWTAFLDTAARLYKYPFDEQLMIYAQRPEATACADYALWNERMGRYVRKGSKGIALLDSSGDEFRLRYVFDVADTGGSRRPYLWQYRPEHEAVVSAALEERYEIPLRTDLAEQFESIAIRLADEYWNEHQRDILGIVDGSFLEEYDEFNIGAAFRSAVVASTTYTLMARCGLEPGERLEHEDFSDVFDFNTPKLVRALGKAVSQNSEEVLRRIEITIKNYERERRQEHERDHLQPERGLYDSEHRPPRDDRHDPVGDVRQDAPDVSEGTPPDPVERHAAGGDAVPAPAGDRPDGERETGSDDPGAGGEGRSDGGAESQRPDEMGGPDEQLQGPGGGDHQGGADLQLTEDDSGQSSLFPSEAEQIESITEAESAQEVTSALTFSQEEIDNFFRVGSNSDHARMGIVESFSKPLRMDEYVAVVKKLFHDGFGLQTADNMISAWYAEDGIHLAQGKSARYEPDAQIISWGDAANRISELLETGRFATNVELAEAHGYELDDLAERILYLYRDLTIAAHREGHLSVLDEINGGGFPDEKRKLVALLENTDKFVWLEAQFRQFVAAWEKDHGLLRFSFYKPHDILRRLDDLNLPRRDFRSDITAIDDVSPFITDDEIDAVLASGSGYSDGKSRIYEFFQGDHTAQEKIDFLKNEYGTGGRSDAVSRNYDSWLDHDSKGIVLRKHECAPVTLTWAKVAKRIDAMIAQDRYLTPEEMSKWADREASRAIDAHEAEFAADGNRVFPDNEPLPPEKPYQPTQEDIDAAIQSWNNDMDSKRRVQRYMLEHAREKGTAAWLRGEFGGDLPSFTVDLPGVDNHLSLTWPKVQRRLAQLVQQDRFFTEQEQDNFEDIDVDYVREQISRPPEESPFVQQVMIDADRIATEEAATPDLSEQPVSIKGDTITIGEGPVFHEIDIELPEGLWQDEPEVEAVADEATPTAEEDEPIQVEEEPPQQASAPYQVGDIVYIENTEYDITNISDIEVQLLDPTQRYPIFRAESRESFERLLRQDDRNRRITDQLPASETPASYHSEVVEELPAEETGLAYDITIEQFHFDEPTPTPPAPLAENFRITDDHLGEGGPKTKFRANMDAIYTLKTIESEGRQATPEEQETLSRYVGWGGLADAFGAEKREWSSEYKELEAALTPEEYKAARASTLNAHYTSPTVIRAVYEALDRMGFKSGNILEPSMGVGNFFGMLPETMRDSRLYGVELDSISGRIARQLYPKANITVAGFETTDRRDFFDLAIGNVPFGQYQVRDRAYDKLGFNIHNYFFAKALDQVRPGGVVAFVTSRYTLDSKDSTVRKYLAQRADFLGAIRLPNNAFKANAGTDVVSDIVFLQKRDRPIDIEPEWVQTAENADGFRINSYFVEHPEMILGRQSSDSTQYGHQDFTVVPIEGLELAYQLHDAVKYIRGTYEEAELPDLGEDEPLSDTLPADPDVKNYSYTLVNGEVYFRENSVMVRPELNATAKARVKGMIELRDCVHRLIDLQMWESDPAQIRTEQARLNRLYDSFTGKYGLINDRGNRLAFSKDSSYYLLCSLEVLDEDGRLERKADMFSKRTIKQARTITHADTASDALALSIAEKARVDMPYMAQLTGKTEEELAAELRGVIFRLPMQTDADGKPRYVTADEYLSGNVREKLRFAQECVTAGHTEYQDNVEALTAAQPKDLEASEIDVRLGATWIDKSYIQQFMEDTFDPPFYMRHRVQVNFSPYTAEWNITNKSSVGYTNIAAYETYGTSRASAYHILEDTLNLRDIRIYDTVRDPDGKERRVLNSKETTLTQQKQQAIKDAFRDWIWKDPERRQALVRLYNDRFNCMRPREYDGSHITFSGMNPEITLREHQLNAIAHIMYGGNTLLAHEVGAGKTFEMVAAAMESKRLGLCQKSLFVVPNHLTEQWASEFLRLYPSAKILVTTKKDFETKNRKKFCSRIATGDYDAVIIGHSQFERIPVSQERQRNLLEEQLAEIEEGLEELRNNRAEQFTIKSLEKTKKNIEARLEKLTETGRKDDVITFEQLGVDRLFVDEAHSYKNLFLYTKMRNVAGLSTTDAQKSSDMFMKCRYIDELTGGKGVVFATGTPVSNSMTELYTMMRYLQHDMLRDNGWAHFDCWASQFGETTTAIELAPEGTGYRARTRFAKFFNLPELITFWKEAADVKTSDQLDLPRPEAVFHNEVAQPTEIQKSMVQELSERAAQVHSGAVDAKVDNMLKITSDGRKLGLDQRIINPNLPDDPGSKVNMCVDNIFRIWQDGAPEKLTQLVFCDISTPKGHATAAQEKAAKSAGDKVLGAEFHVLASLTDTEPDAPFSVYDDIRAKLIERGIPSEQIAFIHDANTEARKKELFAKVRSGQVRVLMGSTFKMGAGMNVQDRLIALHDLDCPWRPGDLEQRAGRIIRQGNKNPEVHIYRYVTEGTFDSYLWQTVENKQKFISQIMTSKSPVRSCEDLDETALSYAEIKALCAGDPRIKEKMDLDIEVARLRLLKADHSSRQYRLEDAILTTYPKQIETAKGQIEGFKADMETLAQYPIPELGFVGMEVRGDQLTDKDNAGAAILEACKEAKGLEPVEIGHYRGMSMSITLEDFGKNYYLTLHGQMSHRVQLGSDARGNLVRIENQLGAIPQRLENVEASLKNVYAQLEAAKAEVKKPFPQEAELQEKSARLAELNALLDIDGKAQAEPLPDQAVAKREGPLPKSERPSVLALLEQKPPPRETPERPRHKSKSYER